MIAFSFVIPHKNSPSLLKACLDTIPRRDDVQIIVVDDDSNPDIVDYQHFPGIDDPVVEVLFTKEGRGAGFARNEGMKHAIGKWVVFADADDFFNPCISEAMDEYVSSNADVVFLKNTSIVLPDCSPSIRGAELNRRVDIALQSGDCSLAILYSSPWQKFFKREFLEKNDIRFNEVRWGNDVVFMGRVAAAAKVLTASDKPVYCLTESAGSIIKTISLESRIVRFEQEKENVAILRKTQYSDESSIYYWLFRTWFDIKKMNTIKSLLLFPSAVSVGGKGFLKEFVKALLHK